MRAEGVPNAGPASNFLVQFSVVTSASLFAINQTISLLGYDQKVDKDMLSWGAAKFDVLERWQQQALSSVGVVLLLCIMYCFFRWACATINYYCCLSKEGQAEADYEEFLKEQIYDKIQVTIEMADDKFSSALDSLMFRGKKIPGGTKMSFSDVRKKQKKIILDDPRSVLDLKLNPRFTASKLKAVGFSAAQMNEGDFTATKLRAVEFTLAELKAAQFTATELRAAEFTATELKAAQFTATELRAAAFASTELKAAIFTAIELRAAGFTLAQLKEAQYTATTLKAAGFTLAQLKVAQFTVRELVGFTVHRPPYHYALFKPCELKAAQFTAREMKAAYEDAKNFPDCFSKKEMRAEGFIIRENISRVKDVYRGRINRGEITMVDFSTYTYEEL